MKEIDKEKVMMAIQALLNSSNAIREECENDVNTLRVLDKLDAQIDSIVYRMQRKGL